MKIIVIIFSFLILLATSSSSGNCGENCQFSISGTTLSFSGSGKMKDFYGDSEIPWNTEKASITKISISGITSIGQKAFQNMKKLESVEFGQIVEIGDGAFIILDCNQ